MKRVTPKITVPAVSHHVPWAVVRQEALDLALGTQGLKGSVCHTCHAGKPGARESTGKEAGLKKLYKAVQPHLASTKSGGLFWCFVSPILSWP